MNATRYEHRTDRSPIVGAVPQGLASEALPVRCLPRIGQAALFALSLAIMASAVSAQSENTNPGDAFGYCADELQQGWNFYCDPTEKEPTEETAQPEPPSSEPEPEAPEEEEPPSYTEQIAAYRAELEETKARAILEPTAENVQAYMVAQQQMTQIAGEFTDQWQRVLFKTPELDINTRFPLSAFGNGVYQDEMREARRASLIEAASNLGFMVVVEDPTLCGLCTPQLEILARMQANFGIELIVVSRDGSFHPLFPEAVVDTGQLRALGLDDRAPPFMALVDPRQNIVEPIGAGLVTEEVILERVHVITKVPVGERYATGAADTGEAVRGQNPAPQRKEPQQ